MKVDLSKIRAGDMVALRATVVGQFIPEDPTNLFRFDDCTVDGYAISVATESILSHTRKAIGAGDTVADLDTKEFGEVIAVHGTFAWVFFEPNHRIVPVCELSSSI